MISETALFVPFFLDMICGRELRFEIFRWTWCEPFVQSAVSAMVERLEDWGSGMTFDSGKNFLGGFLR